MAMPSATPSSSAGARTDSRADAEHAGPLHAWLYEVKPDGTSNLMGPHTGQPMATVQPGSIPRVSVKDADWFPRLGGPERSLANHLAAFCRLVELRTITLLRVCEWAVKHNVEPNTIIDKELIPRRGEH